MPAFTMRDNNNTNTNRGANGGRRVGGLFAGAAGDLSGTTAAGGANGDGTVFDVPSIDGSDGGTPASFIGTDGAYPDAGLIADVGDLSGTTIGAFANTDTDAAAVTATDSATTVAAAAAPTFTTLVSFNGGNGAVPLAGLLADAAGDLFGTRREARRWRSMPGQRRDRRPDAHRPAATVLRP